MIILGVLKHAKRYKQVENYSAKYASVGVCKRSFNNMTSTEVNKLIAAGHQDDQNTDFSKYGENVKPLAEKIVYPDFYAKKEF